MPKDTKSNRKFRLVGEVNESTMDGSTDLEKMVNAYITKQFVLSRDVPSDECLDEARDIIKMVRDYYQDKE
jgi:hypothetical protein